MASQVNKKFVIGLSASIIVVLALLFIVAPKLLFNSANDLARKGDSLMKEGKYKDAAEAYSRAVNKEQTNAELLRKWIEALKADVPDSRIKYSDNFNLYLRATRKLATVVTDDWRAQRDYLEMMVKLREGVPFSRELGDEIIRESDTFLAYHAKRGPGEWDVLKKYRGAAKLRMAIEIPQSKPEFADEALADMDAALKADPTDAEIATTLEAIANYLSKRATENGNAELSQQMAAKAAQVFPDFLAKDPKNPTILIASIRRDMAKAIEALGQAPSPETIQKANADFQKRNLPILDEIAAQVEARDHKKIDIYLVNNLRQIESMIDTKNDLGRTKKILSLARAARPDDYGLIATESEMLAAQNDLKGAIDSIQKLVDLPNRPMGVDGIKLFDARTGALFYQATWAIRRAEATKEAADKEAAMAQAREFRTKFGNVEQSTSPRITLLDAQYATVQEEYGKALRLYEDFNKATNRSNPEALFQTAMVASRINQSGKAIECLQTALAIQPDNFSATRALADLYFSLQKWPEAGEYYGRVIRMNPKDEEVRRRISIIEAGGSNNKTASDPVAAVLINADRIAENCKSQPDCGDQVIAYLKGQIAPDQFNFEPRVSQALAVAYLRMNRRQDALDTIAQGLSKNPDNVALREMQLGLTESDPVKVQIEVVKQRKLPELDEALTLYGIYKSANRNAEAKAQLDRAVKVDPNDKRALELLFIEAIDQKDVNTARAIKDKAVTGDFDNAGGRTFIARVQATEGKIKDAIVTMQEVVNRGGAAPEAYRLLGRLQTLDGRPADAITSYREALRLRPTDIMTAKDLIGTLLQGERRDEALGVAREVRPYAIGDADFINNWLNLEATNGDRDEALRQREAIARADPNDRDNNVILASLYTERRNFKDARAQIDRLLAGEHKNDPEVVALDANWHWSQNNRDKAKEIFTKAIESVDPSKRTTDPYVNYARFLLQRQDLAGAVQQLEDARKYQDPKTVDADRSLCEAYFTYGDREKAIEAARRVIAANADTPDKLYVKRIVECLTIDRKFDDAEKELAPLLTADPDAVTMVMAADIKGGKGEPLAQRDLLDRAVARYPADAAVFIKRGQFLMRETKTMQNAIADLNKAIQLQPDRAQGYRLRAGAHLALGNTDEAFKDLRSALRINPQDNDLLGGLITTLVNLDRLQEAREVADEILKRRPRDSDLMVAIGTFFGQQNRWDVARNYLRPAFELDKRDGVAQPFLDSLLRAEPPDLREAETVLASLGERVTKNPGFLMASAQLRMKQGKPSDAARLSSESLKLVGEDQPLRMIAWFNDMRRLTNNDRNKLREFIENISRQGQSVEWMGFFRGMLLTEEPASFAQGIETYRAIAKSTKNKGLQLFAYRTLGTSLYGAERYEDSAAALAEGLQAFPGDTELSNNLAFMYLKFLNKPEEASVLAEAASKKNPDSPEILDTLGVAYLRTNKIDEAVATLERAVVLGSRPTTLVSSQVHFAEALIKKGQKERAREILKAAKQLIDANPSIPADVKADYEKMMEQSK